VGGLRGQRLLRHLGGVARPSSRSRRARRSSDEEPDKGGVDAFSERSGVDWDRMYSRDDRRMFEWYDPLDSLYRFCLNWFQARRSASWPRMDATILNAEAWVIESESGKAGGWIPEVVYEYEVYGIPYQGRTTGEIWYYENDAASETARSLIGSTLPIRCSPSNPAKSIHLRTDGGPAQLLPSRPDPDSGLVTLSLK
jgi:hypothetical protein